MNSVLLEEKLNSSGLKKNHVAKMLGISPQGLSKKRKGSIPFTVKEINIMKDLLNLTNSERDKIFLQ